jgi:Initiator Replication protein
VTRANRPKGSQKELRTLDVVPNFGEMIKPSELIDIIGAGHLTLASRRLYNLLIAHAFGPAMATKGRVFEIPLDDLRGTHDSNDRLTESIEALMRTVVIARLPDGTTTRVQLLGGNNIGAPDRERGRLRYSFPPELVPLLRDSRVFGILELRVMAAISTKYGLALYEALCRRVRMERVGEELSLEGMRELLGVEDGRLKKIGNLKSKAIEPAVREINALAPFSVRVDDVRQRKAVVGFKVWWWPKAAEDYRAAIAELERTRIGRSARIRGTVEAPAD